ncbi:MAG TPA: SMC family ATPase [Acidimicrobiales bacterium]|nr:SMC family ATPase [Acidimicrobiales bacterium]
MRPVRLEVEGFTVFRDARAVDFAGADLFALVGATGAGKTSVIDAVTFALYGSVPRLDDKRAVAPVISQNLTEARVRLDFTVDGEPHTAVRVVRATRNGATTKEARLERRGEVLAGTAKEVTEAVTALLGLTYEHFITCASLPQGQFARFLHDEPRDRQDLLVRLLDLGLYERVAGVARQRAIAARTTAELAAGQLERLVGATPEARAEAEAQVAALAALGERLAAARPEVDEGQATIAREQAEAEAVTAQLRLLDALVVPEGTDALATELATAVTTRDRCGELREEACEAVAEGEAQVKTLPARPLLDGQRLDHARRADLAAQVERGEVREAEVRAELEGAATAAEAAGAQRDERAQHLERVRVELRAQSLIPELAVGHPCPVCGHEVAALPAHEHPPDLAKAERDLADAERAARRADEVLVKVRSGQVRVDEKLGRVRQDLAEVAARLVGVPDLAALDDQLALVDEAESALDKARQAERDARKAVAAATRHHDQVAERVTRARRAFDAARDGVAALGPPPAERADLAADWGALVGWAATRAPALVEVQAAHREAAEAVRAEVAARLGEVAAACREAGVEPPPGTWPGEAVAAAHARAEAARARIDEQLAAAERLRADQRAATEQHHVADALAGHLAANRFEKWLLDEALQQLVAGASTLLAELSAGAYALAVDGRTGGFAVIDHTHASQVRSARTLSGGETFLASLALALALADQVAGLAVAGAARLEALFLDEGFGTLDPETLDVVATALDELGARGRMVGVVTHVRELAERLPVRFEVRKVGGASVVERVES